MRMIFPFVFLAAASPALACSVVEDYRVPTNSAMERMMGEAADGAIEAAQSAAEAAAAAQSAAETRAD